MRKNFFDHFWGIFVLSTLILYVSMGLTKLDEKYDLKIMVSSFSVLGQHKNLLELENDSDLNLTTMGEAAVISLIESGAGSAKSIRSSDAKSKRFLASSFAETDLRYHLKIKTGNWLPTTLDFSTNVLYNVSYILNTPVKLVHNIKANFQIDDAIFPLSQFERWVFVFWDILHAVSGVGIAFIMILLGGILGLVCHPIHSVVNFIPSLWQLIMTLWNAISHFANIVT